MFQVLKIIKYQFFSPAKLINNLALLILKSDVVYGDFVQPACIWNDDAKDKLKEMDSSNVYGSVSINDAIQYKLIHMNTKIVNIKRYL